MTAMDTLNTENAGIMYADSIITRVTRGRRAALSNVTNTQDQQTNAVLKKAKKSVDSTKYKQPSLPDQDSYIEDIINYLVKMEQQLDVCPNYMDKQHDLKPVMRSILVDWIVQACTKFKVTDETQYYAIQYIDRFLSLDLIERSNLQLVGICAIFVACKFEEVSVPSMSDLCYITEDTYTAKELQWMEAKMLKVLDYDLGYPTSIQFLRYIVKVFSFSRQQYYYAKFICELMSVSYPALHWKPSEIAVSSLDILNKISTFLPVLRQLNFDFSEPSIAECKRFIRTTILNDELSEHVTVFNKFESVYTKLKSELSSVAV